MFPLLRVVSFSGALAVSPLIGRHWSFECDVTNVLWLSTTLFLPNDAGGEEEERRYLSFGILAAAVVLSFLFSPSVIVILRPSFSQGQPEVPRQTLPQVSLLLFV